MYLTHTELGSFEKSFLKGKELAGEGAGGAMDAMNSSERA